MFTGSPPAYPTADRQLGGLLGWTQPSRGCDYKAGVGPVDARDLALFCNPARSTDCSDPEATLPCVDTGSGPYTPSDPEWQPVASVIATEDQTNMLPHARRLVDAGAYFDAGVTTGPGTPPDRRRDPAPRPRRIGHA